MRANRKTVMAKEEAYLIARPVLPPRPANPPPDTPEAMRVAVERAIAFERLTGECAHGACVACRGPRLNATYRKGRGGEKICPRCPSDKQGVLQGKTTRFRHGLTRMGRRDTTCLTLSPLSPLQKSS